jgi:hypothetical protein
MIDVEQMVENVCAVYNAAHKGADAVQWYAVANEWIVKTAQVFDISEEIVAYVVATLSPKLRWDKNQESALAMLELQVWGFTQKRNSALGANTQKVLDAFDGLRPYKATGDKVSSFQRNLLGDYDAVTIDRHAIAIALRGLNAIGTDSGDVKISKAQYSVFVQAYRIAAERLNENPVTVQSITWCAVGRKSRRQ